MELTIEDKPMTPRIRRKDDGEWAAFVAAVPTLKVGQSFVVKHYASHYRTAAALASSWLGIQLTFAPEGKHFRVGRTV